MQAQEEEEARPRKGHPLDVRPLSSDNRFQQSKHEVFPLPMKAAFVASSGGGKSSAAISAIMSLWPVWTRVVIFARTASVDPAFDELKRKIKSKLQSKGIDPDDAEEE